MPDLPILARARDPNHARRLEELGATTTVLETLEASLQLGGAVLHETGMDWRDVEELIRQLRFVNGISNPLGTNAEPEGLGDEISSDPVLAAAAMVEEEEAEAAGEGTPASSEPPLDGVWNDAEEDGVQPVKSDPDDEADGDPPETDASEIKLGTPLENGHKRDD